VPRNDLRLRVGDFHDLPCGGDHAIDGTALIHADVGITERRGHIADMHDIRTAKIDDRIAIRVRGFGMVDENLFPIEVQRHAVAIGNDRQRPGARGIVLRRSHSLAHVVMRNDHGAELRHGFIAGGVIPMEMRVHDVADRAGC